MPALAAVVAVWELSVALAEHLFERVADVLVVWFVVVVAVVVEAQLFVVVVEQGSKDLWCH